MGIIEALKKMTMVPAKRLGLSSKGDIKVGKDADIVIFDPYTIIDEATFDEPNLPPKGIDYVIVNGEMAVKDNNILKGRLGRVIRNNELNRGGLL